MRSILTISYPHPDDRSSRAVISMYGIAPFENLPNAGAGTNCKAGITALCLLVLCSLLAAPVSAGMTTTDVTVTKLASDGVTVLNQTTVDWQWMKENLPVIGDGETIYYMQGPIFEDAWNEAHPGETYDPWNPTEDVNLIYKDHGEFMGTDVADLLDLVGGAEPQDRVKFVASDGLPKEWPAEYIYSPNARQGPFCLAWYHGSDTGYVNQSFTDGMRLYFLGETTNADGMHVWGNWDMHESWAEDYWYYYSGIYPSASGVSVQNIKTITIYSNETPRTPIADFTAEPVAGEAPLTVQFNDTSANVPTEWDWDFGDGMASAEQNPKHTYQNDGVYTVMLTVSNDQGSDTCTRENLIAVEVAGPHEPQTYVVDADGSADFTTIQAAVDAARAGDSVIVRDGTYQDNVVIGKSIVVRSENGPEKTIIRVARTESKDDHVISVTADGAVVSGFTLRDAETGGAGLGVFDATGCTFADLVCTNNSHGISLHAAPGNEILNCSCNNCYRGVDLYEGSDDTLVTGCNLSYNADYGIWAESSGRNQFIWNTLVGAEGGGAINLRASCDNLIAYNVLDCCNPQGAHCLVVEWGSENNTVYMNDFLSSVLLVTVDAGPNAWNSTEPVSYVYENRTYSGYVGNYWENVGGRGYTGEDADGDGIGDTIYSLPVHSPEFSPQYDRYPLAERFGNYVGEGNVIPLSQGWNFISVPRTLASGLDTAAVFSGVSMVGRPMYSYDAVAGWKTLRADDPLSPLMAYWVYSETPCTVPLTFDPDPVSTPPERTLAQGWNAVGFTGFSPTSARNAFLSIVDEWSCAIGFGAGEQRYEVSFINGAQGAHGDGRDLEPMQGYWVFMRSAGRLCAISG